MSLEKPLAGTLPVPKRQDAFVTPSVSLTHRDDAGTMRLLLGIAATWFVLRLLYMMWLSPWDLVGDEAYYWMQGQHLALSYAEKGPLLAWMLHAADWLLGSHEWVVRLPVLAGSALGVWGAGMLTLMVAPGNRRAAILAAALYILIPAFIANGQITTQDGILIPWLLALSALGLWVVRRWEDDGPTWGPWLLFYAVMGIGMLLKQSILLFMTAFVVYAVLRRRSLRWDGRLVLQQIAGGVIMGIACLPLIIWDAQHGWPLVRHTLEHLGVVKGTFNSGSSSFKIQWLGNTLAGILGAGGPAVVLMGWASVAGVRDHGLDDRRWRDSLWLMCTAWPSIGFFVLLSLHKAVVPSWPLPSLVSLVPLAALFLAERLPAPGPRRLWRATLGYGAFTLLVLSFPTLLAHLPRVGPRLQAKVLSRLTGARAEATHLESIAAAHPSVRWIVFPHYMETSQMAFYMPRRWAITCAGSLIGKRLSNYDEWSDTSLYGPAPRGADMLLVGRRLEDWQSGLRFAQVEPLGDGVFLGKDYAGPAHPLQPSKD